MWTLGGHHSHAGSGGIIRTPVNVYVSAALVYFAVVLETTAFLLQVNLKTLNPQ